MQSQYVGTNIETFCNALGRVFSDRVAAPAETFRTAFYDLDSAEGAGLDLWGEFVGFPRHVGTRSGFTTRELTDTQYRSMLKLRVLQLHTRCTIPELNGYAQEVFGIHGSGKVYIEDKQEMTFIIYVFEFIIPEWLKFVFNNYDILPRPAGVGVKVRDTNRVLLAFKGQAQSNFYRVGFAAARGNVFTFDMDEPPKGAGNFYYSHFYKEA